MARQTPGTLFPSSWSRSPANMGIGAITLAGALADSRGCGSPKMRILGSYALVYLLAGSGRYVDAAGTDRAVSAGDLLVLFPELAHRYGPGQGERWREVYLVFEGPVFDLWRQHGLLVPEQPVRRLEPINYWLPRLAAVVGASPSPEPGAALAEVCRLQTLLAEAIAAVSESSDAWAQQARRLLEADDPAEAAVHVVANRMHLSPDAFRKRFTRALGISPHRYRSARLIERACRLMQAGELTDQQIADRLGFTDPSHFSRRFSQIMGRSPREFRRQLPRRRFSRSLS
jgi:AraC-like DNA-binding protein